MENNQNSVPPAMPQSDVPSGGNVYFGSGQGGTARPMPSRKRLYAIAGAATVLVLATGGYVLGYYLPNKPSNVYKTALTNTADGYDQLVSYAGNEQVAKKFQNTEFEGAYKVEGAGLSTDGTFSGHSDKANATFSGDLGLGTTRVKLDTIVKDVPNSESPDAYLKVSGIKGLGSQAGVPALDTLDNQWVSVDHTFFDNLTQQAQQAQGLQSSGSMTPPSQKDVVAAAKAVGEQSRKYLFNTDKATAVFKMDSFVGKETVDGKQTNHYKVTANKDHLKTYLKELGKALDKTKLGDWAKKTYNRPLSEVIDTEGMAKSADGIKSGDTFDLWVNTKTKLVHKVRFSDTKDPKSNYIELGLNSNGGAEKPLFLNFRSNQDGQKLTGTMVLTLNASNNKVKFNVDVDSDQSGSTTKFNFNVAAQPASGKVDTAVPSNAISLSEALNRIGLGGYLDLLTQGLSQSLTAAEGGGANPFTVSL